MRHLKISLKLRCSHWKEKTFCLLTSPQNLAWIQNIWSFQSSEPGAFSLFFTFLVAAHSCSVQAQWLRLTGLVAPSACGILVPWPGIEAESSALEGRFHQEVTRTLILDWSQELIQTTLKILLWVHQRPEILSSDLNEIQRHLLIT